MKLLEIYACYQGEGKFIGTPSVLVRFFGCNLRCVWCDTAYSINPKLHEENMGPPIKDVEPWVLLKMLKEYELPVIVTGGEPTVQSDLITLLRGLVAANRHVTVETNGTHYIPVSSFDDIQPGRILWSISPKMSGAQTGPVNVGVLHQFLTHWWSSDVQFKFVITGTGDLDESLQVLKDAMVPNDYLIVLQPEGSVMLEGYEPYLARLGWLEKMVMSHEEWKCRNVRVLPQLHALIHGARVRNV